MANVTWADGLQVSRWAKELYSQAKNDTYLSRFFGGSGSAIQVLDNLKASKGKDITVGLKMKIDGSGVTGDSTLAGNEVAIDNYSQTVTLDQLRQGVLSTGKMHNKKVLQDFRKEALDSLKIWFAETMEKDMMDTLSGVTRASGTSLTTYTFGPTSGGGDMDYTVWNDNGTIKTTTPAAALASADVITPKLISFAAARAKTLSTKIRPVRANGKDYYILLVHPESAHELKQNSTFMNAQQYAMPRGSDNPIFSGALGMWDGVVIHEHDLVQRVSINSVHANRNLFLGAQAGIAAYGSDHAWHEELVDRGNKLSISAAVIYEFAKANFNSTDFAVMELPCFATSMSS